MDSYILKINELIKRKKLDKEAIAVDIGVKRATFYNYLNGSTKMPVNILINLSNYLEVSVGSFFEDEKNINSGVANGSQINGNHNKVSIKINQQANEIEKLKEKIKYLENTIKDKEVIIELLKNK